MSRAYKNFKKKSQKNQQKKQSLIARHKKLAVSLSVFLAIIIACFCYLGTYYKADITAIEAFSSENTLFEQKTLDDNTIILEPENTNTGFIFYPGGKVEYTAYLPLLKACAENDIMCALIKMPFNLAVFDYNAADKIREMYPDIENWYIGGHSLGGAMASYHTSENADKYKGVILLGAYSSEDLSDKDLKILSVYGTEDKILDMDKYEEYKKNLPESFNEIIISGGCHSYFGMYGEQFGDGTPSIENIDQITSASTVIVNFIYNSAA